MNPPPVTGIVLMLGDQPRFDPFDVDTWDGYVRPVGSS